MKTKIILICLVLTTFSFSAQAQEKIITGTVTTQADGMPIPGVNVIIEGTSTGTVTDFDGNYSIEASTGDVLVFSYLGYMNQKVTVGTATEYSIALEEDASQLEEVVVVGYGTQEKQDVTGAISSVSSEEIMKQPSSTATEALQGKIAGVNIINSSAPGATPTVIIRGLGTALGGRDPLYVVDGVPVNNIQNISPSNIESIDVLKDASSAAIYGVRAANGVIIVTTKQGKSGKATFGIRSYYGVKPILNSVEMANASQYITYFNEENEHLGEEGDFLNASQPYNTDWYDEVTQLGSVNNIAFDVSGGGENINYFFSYDYYEEEGILPDQKYIRSTVTSNNTYKLFDDRLNIIQNLNFSIRNETPKPFGAFNNAFRQSPLVPVYYPNGRYGQPFYNSTTGEFGYMAEEGEQVGKFYSHPNPVASLNFTNQKNKTFNIQGSITAELKITDYLTFTSRFGARKEFFSRRAFNPNRARWIAGDPTRTIEDFQDLKSQNPEGTQYANNVLSFGSGETYKYNWDNFLNFNKEFGDHSFDVTLGGSKEQVGIGFEDNYQAYDVPEDEQYWSLKHASGAYEDQVNQFYYTPTNFLSYFGRLQYNFNSKYYLTGTIRRDGSSNFANNADYWGTFPAVGLGWTLTEENFLEDSETFNFLKLRGSWGKLGNASVPFNADQILTNPGSSGMNYVLGPNQRLIYGGYIGSPARDISWEVVEEWSIGLDYELFDYKLSGSLDVYQRTTENTILRVQPLLNSTYATEFFDHGAEVINKGFEIAANWSDGNGEDFSYSIGANVSYNQNEVTSVATNYEGQEGGALGFGGIITKRLEEGQPLGSWWMYETNGVWQTQEEINNNAALGTARPGHLRYVDQNNDGAIDDRDKIFMGTYIPKVNYGINVGLNYKQFDFSIDGYGVAGNKVYNSLKAMRLGGENVSEQMFLNRWTGPGSTNVHPGADRDIEASDYYLEDGDFFRINNITLGYTLPEIADYIKDIRIYVSAQNPVIFTDYSGFTPELSSNGDPYGKTGIEISAYPITSTYLVGLNISL